MEWILVLMMFGMTPNNPAIDHIPGWQSEQECVAMAKEWQTTIKRLAYYSQAMCIPQKQLEPTERGSRSGKVGG